MTTYLSKEALESMPKKSVNSYMLFRGDHFADLKLKNADKSMIEVTKIIGEMWNDLDEKRKNEVNQRAENLKDEYEKDYAAWLKKYKLDEDKAKKALKDIKAQKADMKKARTKKSKSDDEEPHPKMAQKKGKAKNAKISDEDDSESEKTEPPAKMKQKEQTKQQTKDQSKQQHKEEPKQQNKQNQKEKEHEKEKDLPKQQAPARRKSQGKKAN